MKIRRERKESVTKSEVNRLLKQVVELELEVQNCVQLRDVEYPKVYALWLQLKKRHDELITVNAEQCDRLQKQDLSITHIKSAMSLADDKNVLLSKRCADMETKLLATKTAVDEIAKKDAMLASLQAELAEARRYIEALTPPKYPAQVAR